MSERVVFKPGATVAVGRRGRYRSAQNNLAFHRSMTRFYRKFYAPSASAPVAAVVYLGIGAKLLVSLVVTAFRRSGR